MRTRFVLLPILFLLLTNSFNVTAQWSTTPSNHLMISPQGLDPKLCSDGDGGAYIAWRSFNYDKNRVYLQHVDKFGYKTLATPMVVCDTNDVQLQFDMIEDGYDGVLVLVGAEKWIDKYSNYRYTKLFVQRIDKNLNKQWGENGVRVSMKENDQNCYADPKIVSDKKNNAYILFGDRREENYDEIYNLYMQRIQYDGQRMWSDTGITVATDVVTPKWFLLTHITNRVISWYAQAGGSGAWRRLVGYDSLGVKVWEKMLTDNYLHFGNVYDKQLFITRSLLIEGYHERFQATLFNSSGDSLWNEWITLTDSSHFNSTTSNVRTIYDTVLVANYYKLVAFPSTVRQYTQAISTSGNLLFPFQFRFTNKDLNSYALGDFVQGQNGEFLALYSTIDSVNMTYIQKMNLKGELLWGGSGVLLSDMTVPGMGGVFFYYLTTDQKGGAIASGSNEPQNGIYVQQVSKDGKLGDIITLVSKKIPPSTVPITFQVSEPYPNPFNPSTTFAFVLQSRSFVSLKVFDAIGRTAAIILSQEMEAGHHSFQWNASSLSSGVYFLRLQAGSLFDTKKLMLLR